MTNDELNRKVAELRGWKPWLEYTYRDGSVTRWRNEVPNYCDDPAAWGGLLSELATESMQITLVFIKRPKPLKEWGATIWRGHKMWMQSDDTPGRALCLAYVTSQEGR